jgi:hypothetical protein
VIAEGCAMGNLPMYETTTCEPYHIIAYYNPFKMPRGLGRKGITTEIDSQYTAELAARNGNSTKT